MTKIPPNDDCDPQAEMVGRFIEMGWTPPDELEAKIKQAQEDERKRIEKHLRKLRLWSMDATNFDSKAMNFIRNIMDGNWEALKGRDPSQEGGE